MAIASFCGMLMAPFLGKSGLSTLLFDRLNCGTLSVWGGTLALACVPHLDHGECPVCFVCASCILWMANCSARVCLPTPQRTKRLDGLCLVRQPRVRLRYRGMCSGRHRKIRSCDVEPMRSVLSARLTPPLLCIAQPLSIRAQQWPAPLR